ncbi:hypothetical protein CLHUN_33030 [Ruminiclostridium hungatei]|uniref:Uncharacterized protein n=1 Tax=Ruminiclostridium hungatei TaxID=48256 RepID=A0A1V4SG06_RUMHU|nr:hypothetical protein CLHUN_33030 [Ruminiclostridium hungatei]
MCIMSGLQSKESRISSLFILFHVDIRALCLFSRIFAMESFSYLPMAGIPASI